MTVMKPRFVSELAAGASVDGDFVLRSKQMRSSRTGDAYLAVELADRSGAIPGVLFRPSGEAASVPSGAVVRVSGRVTVFRGVKRISIDLMRPAARWDPSDLMATSPRAVDEMVGEFTRLVRSVSHKGLRATLRVVFGDSDVYDRFVRCPGAQSHHHAYIGGLLEHTVSVASLCSSLAERYEGVSRDLLVASALLHDIGKVDELSIDSGIGYTDEGRLIGHVVLGARRVDLAATSVGLDRDVAARLQHAMLSHHGELEWGSPRRPSTIEALLLHHADNLDAKAAGLSSLLSGASRAEESWTDASNLFRRPLYAPRPMEDDRPIRPSEDDLSSVRTA